MPSSSLRIKSNERCRDAEVFDTPQPSLELAKGATGLGLRSALEQGGFGGRSGEVRHLHVHDSA